MKNLEKENYRILLSSLLEGVNKWRELESVQRMMDKVAVGEEKDIIIKNLNIRPETKNTQKKKTHRYQTYGPQY